jgi:CRISPR-associated endonuclease/helicase Cas3
VVLEAATGSGKTEAALAHFFRLFHAALVDGMYFALPTRVAATQIHQRVLRAIAHAFPP